MTVFIEKLMGRLQVTPAIAWSIGGTLLSGLTGPVVALLIAQQFSPEMQGYYYTFNSLLAMSVFLELGFNGCIVQFISHEYAHLKIQNGRIEEGEARFLGRLASLVRLSLKWYMIAAILMLVGVGVAGELFFKFNPTSEFINWRGPWWCLCALSAMNLMILPLSALLDGCDQVNWTSRVRVLQNLCRSSVLIGGLVMGLALYAPAVAMFCALIVFVFQFKAKWNSLIKQVLRCSIEEQISWVKEVFPMQWRIALSWISGYFIFSIFSPLLFASSGADAAGRFGMTWTFIMAINSISVAFSQTRGPKFGAYIAKQEWVSLHKLWRVALVQSVGICVGLMTVFFAFVVVVSYVYPNLGSRLISLENIILISAATILNQVTFSVSILARAEKREPFLWVSIFVAIIIGVGSYTSVSSYGVTGIAVSYLAGSLVSVLWSFRILNETEMAVALRKMNRF
jgi:O-antigen/teichoic acid export membrane protein